MKTKQNFDELESEPEVMFPDVSVFQADRSSPMSARAEILATCAGLPDSAVVTVAAPWSSSFQAWAAAYTR